VGGKTQIEALQKKCTFAAKITHRYMSEEKKKLTPLSDLGEFGVIDQLTKNIETHHPSTLKGIGDDCAVLNHNGEDVVVTTDMLIEGVHFDLTYAPLMHLGYKAVAVNVSDIYSMNAQPKQITVSLAISKKFSLEAVEKLYEGIKKACENYDVDLVGGDTCSSLTGLAISITAIGTIEKDKAVYRSGAKPGDAVFVSGDLGAAYAGLQILKREKEVFMVNPNNQPQMDNYDYVLERQLKPEARKDIVAQLNNTGIKPNAMIDISDGLSSELLHICKASDVGVKIHDHQIPIDVQTLLVADELNIDKSIFALSGGEDYELMFTISPKDLPKMKAIDGVTQIGEIVDKKEGRKVFGKSGGSAEITAQGWNAYDK
jgi:thiamine-monophosphate kinase